MLQMLRACTSGVVLSVIVLFGPTATNLVPMPEVLANGPCGTSVSNDQGQAIGKGYGAYAYITAENSSFCSGSSSSSNTISAWALIAGDAGSSGREYVQAGYLKRFGIDSSPYPFTEYDESSSYSFVRTIWTQDGTLSNGTNWSYSTYYDTSVDREYAVINGTQSMETNFNPNNVWGSPWSSQWSGEVHDTGDEIPGTSASPAAFTSVGYEASEGGGFSTPSSEVHLNDQGCQSWYNDATFSIYHC